MKFWLLIMGAVLAALFQTGCSLFFGSVKPVEEKSDSYGIMDLSKTDSDWSRLDPKSAGNSKETGAPPESGISDVVFQSKSSASIISINSACKSYPSAETKPKLQDLTRELLLGFSDISQKDEEKLVIEGVPALQTTVHGKLNREEVMIRTVVLQRVNCVYDLMYISRPEKFINKEADFSRFVSSLHLR